MRIAVDVMGGDKAPREVVRGAVNAARRFPDTTLILVGQEDIVNQELQLCQNSSLKNIEIVHASQAVAMNESPVASLKEKRDSSIIKIADLVKSGDAQSMVSMGNTGVVVAAAQLRLRLLEGIRRAGIAVPIPSMKGPCILIDAGANIAPKPEHLVDYAIMATVYSKYVFGKENPKVGLLNVGEEDEKGNDFSKEALKQLKETPVNFFRNVEGRDIFSGLVDIVVCDGFSGNSILKATEGAGAMIMNALKEEFTKNIFRKISAFILKNAFRQLKARLDYAEYGGALLLGVNGVVIIGHGGSNARAVENSIRVAREAVIHNLNGHIIENAKKAKASRASAQGE